MPVLQTRSSTIIPADHRKSASARAAISVAPQEPRRVPSESAADLNAYARALSGKRPAFDLPAGRANIIC